MTVLRITSNIATAQVSEAHAFYQDFLGLDLAMDLGWISTFQGPKPAPVQISIASEGGAGTDVPDLSIEVDDVDTVYAKAQQSGLQIIYPLTDEEWGVRRFYVRDPFGSIVNILAHTS